MPKLLPQTQAGPAIHPLANKMMKLVDSEMAFIEWLVSTGTNEEVKAYLQDNAARAQYKVDITKFLLSKIVPNRTHLSYDGAGAKKAKTADEIKAMDLPWDVVCKLAGKEPDIEVEIVEEKEEA